MSTTKQKQTARKNLEKARTAQARRRSSGTSTRSRSRTGVMTTAHGVSPGVSAAYVWTSLIGFTLLYGVLAVVEVGLLARYVRRGPEPFVEPPSPSLGGPGAEDADEPLTFAY